MTGDVSTGGSRDTVSSPVFTQLVCVVLGGGVVCTAVVVIAVFLLL